MSRRKHGTAREMPHGRAAACLQSFLFLSAAAAVCPASCALLTSLLPPRLCVLLGRLSARRTTCTLVIHEAASARPVRPTQWAPGGPAALVTAAARVEDDTTEDDDPPPLVEVHEGAICPWTAPHSSEPCLRQRTPAGLLYGAASSLAMDSSLELAHAALKRIRVRHGPTSVAGATSDRATGDSVGRDGGIAVASDGTRLEPAEPI